MIGVDKKQQDNENRLTAHEADDEDSGAREVEPNNNQQTIQLKFLESENTNLQLENDDLNTTLKINKDIIKTMLTTDSKFDEKFEYALAQMQQENDLLEQRAKNVQEQRDQLQANFLLQQQILANGKSKEDDFADIYKEEIDELKENLERKEYLLQLVE